jgi:anti-sigma B factor antagonist
MKEISALRNPVVVMEVPAILNHQEGQAFWVELQPLLETDRPRVVLDCSGLQRVDSAGIEILLQCIEAAMKRDGDVKLASVSPASAALMELMRVDRLFEIYDTAEEATRSFHSVAIPETQPTLPWYSAEYRTGEAKAS